MKILRIVGILILVAGIAAILFSNYITNQVNEGKLQIAKGEKQVQQGKSMFSQSPYTAPLGGMVTGSGEKKLKAGKEQIAYYQQMASQLMTGGIVGCIVGGGLFLFSFMNRNKRR
jgi:hypothetical protein